MSLRTAIAEKHRRQAEADQKAEAVIELWRAQARVGYARRRAERHAGAAGPVAASIRQDLLAELENFETRRTTALRLGVL